MKNSLMYKMSYYNYNSLFPAGQAQDRVRGSKLPAVGPELSTVEEAFTSENWIIRIYKVSDSVYDIVAKPSFTRLTKNEIRKEFKPCAITYFFNQPLSKIRLNMFT